jgi:23S rRNA (cytidine2498-2'-O)-methyltransferase
MDQPRFIFTTCQTGAQGALKEELAREYPDVVAAFSRPGLVTFKLPPTTDVLPGQRFHSVFARTQGESLGTVRAESVEACAAAAKTLLSGTKYQEVHIWQRGDRDASLVLPAATALASELQLAAPEQNQDAPAIRLSPSTSEPGKRARVVDCLVVDPQQWLLGTHEIDGPETRWPGGIYNRVPPETMVSRAYLKMDEALAWSQLPVKNSDVVAEIGCAPGGASQALLERGLVVQGVDPAMVDERILANPRFIHIRKRGHEVKRREFRKTHWLTADLNVAPRYTLDTVEEIVTHRDVDIRGMLLTLKLLEWKLAAEIPAYLDRIKKWGYRRVQARQLYHNRQEICVAAFRR